MAEQSGNTCGLNDAVPLDPLGPPTGSIMNMMMMIAIKIMYFRSFCHCIVSNECQIMMIVYLSMSTLQITDPLQVTDPLRLISTFFPIFLSTTFLTHLS